VADTDADPTSRRPAGELEADVLAALWAHTEPASANDVQAALGRPLAYTTVATILVRLCEKGMVRRVRAGRGYLYQPVVNESDHLTGQIRRVLARAGDQSAALQGLVDSLSPDEEAQLLAMLHDRRDDEGATEAEPR
jgi:predicted transcriptional regulator